MVIGCAGRAAASSARARLLCGRRSSAAVRNASIDIVRLTTRVTTTCANALVQPFVWGRERYAEKRTLHSRPVVHLQHIRGRRRGSILTTRSVTRAAVDRQWLPRRTRAQPIGVLTSALSFFPCARVVVAVGVVRVDEVDGPPVEI